MSGIYIHIPFCKSRCLYCGFYSTTLLSLAHDYVEALCREITLRHEEVTEPATTIYIGGGTPSLLGGQLLGRLVQAARQTAPRAREITVECNPDDVTPQFALALKGMGVNRVSMGVQTFCDRRLAFLQRRHTAREAREAVAALRTAGIGNISIDLMYGFPNETLEQWNSDITAALELKVEHISAYALTYEDGTPLFAMVEKGTVTPIGEEQSLAMYNSLASRLGQAGYEHYEISNFAKKGFRSQHNSSYWNATPYIGLGAAAHSYDGKALRRWNVPDVRRYMAGVRQGTVPAEQELLSEASRYNETVMLGLRTCEGVDLDTLRSSFGQKKYSYCMENARKFIASGQLVVDKGHLRLSRKALFVSDMIISELFCTEP